MRDYLTKNPEILVEMTTELDKRQADTAGRAAAKTICENAAALFRSQVSHTAGNPDGDVTVVEFFDYNCGYCRRALTDVVKLINEDGKVRLVLKELPIFGGDSEEAAKIALAADKQGKYFEMHQKLFTEPGKANKEKAMKHRQGARPRHREVGKGRRRRLDATRRSTRPRILPRSSTCKGTPLFLIGDRVVPGAPDDLYDQLKAKVVEVREKGCATTC